MTDATAVPETTVALPTLTPAAPRTSRVRRPHRLGLWASVIWVIFIVVIAVFAGVLPLHPYAQAVPNLPARTGIGLRWPEFLGTDAVGRSIVSRLAYGARDSLLVGVLSVAIGVVIGSVVGVIAGYLRGPIDEVVTIGVDAMMALPSLVLLLTIVSIGGNNLNWLIGALAVLGSTVVTRLVRTGTRAVAGREFVMAAGGMGASRYRIMFREILPNVLPTIVSLAFLFMGVAIMAEAGLSFLGLGIPPPRPSWGGMINDGRQWLAYSPQLVIVPAVALILTVLSLRAIGEHLRRRYSSGVSSA